MSATVLGQTTAVCPQCRRLLPGRLAARDGAVRLRTCCPEHGEIERAIHSDPARWLAEEHYVKPAWIPRLHDGDAAKPCPEGCGHCARHEQHLCMPIVEITRRCDLACPICIADAGGREADGDLEPAAFAHALDRLLAAEGQIDILNLSGGEPLLHPRLLELVDLAQARPGVVRVSLSTNGLRLLEDPALFAALVARRVTISLQCDGLDDAMTTRLRGRPLAAAKRRILDLLAAADCPTSLVMTLARGVNEGRCRELLDLLFDRPHIASLMVQPLALAGRAAAWRDEVPLDVAAAIRLLAAAGHPAVAADDFVPLPCSHPRCFSLAFYLSAGAGRGLAVNRLLPAGRLLDALANRTVFGLDPEEFRTMQDLLYELWSGPVGQGPDARAALDAVRGLLRRMSCCGFDPRTVLAGAERTVKSVFIHGFQDTGSFDLARLRRCCNAYVQPDGRLIPCCARNVLGAR
jgi:uncharacterized radical SAM superfamily Fe-S cluster-containing enzyme